VSEQYTDSIMHRATIKEHEVCLFILLERNKIRGKGKTERAAPTPLFCLPTRCIIQFQPPGFTMPTHNWGSPDTPDDWLKLCVTLEVGSILEY